MVKSRRALKALWSQARGARLVRPVRAIVGRAPASLLSRRDRAHAWPAALPLSHVGGIGQLLTWLVSSRCSDAHANNGIYPNFAGPLLRGGYDRPISPHGDSNDSDTDRLLAGLWTWTGGEELSLVSSCGAAVRCRRRRALGATSLPTKRKALALARGASEPGPGRKATLWEPQAANVMLHR